MKRTSARAIVFAEDGNIILIHRKWKGREYWVTPGGGVEEGESFEEAVKREVREEVGIDIAVGERVLDVTKLVDGRESSQAFFSCTYLSGRIGTGSDEKMRDPDPADFSEVVTVDKKTAETMNIVPPEAKEIILTLMDRKRP